MSQPHMGLVAQGPLPAGMLRIHKGNQERYVWPVHLPGWLALGWQVAGPSSTAAEQLPQAVAAQAVPLELEPEPTAGREKRGRRRKEEQEQPHVGVEATPEEPGTTAETGATDSDPKAAAEPGDDSTAEGAVALSSLPDDLFSDPLI